MTKEANISDALEYSMGQDIAKNLIAGQEIDDAVSYAKTKCRAAVKLCVGAAVGLPFGCFLILVPTEACGSVPTCFPVSHKV